MGMVLVFDLKRKKGAKKKFWNKCKSVFERLQGQLRPTRTKVIILLSAALGLTLLQTILGPSVIGSEHKLLVWLFGIGSCGCILAVLLCISPLIFPPPRGGDGDGTKKKLRA